MQHEDGHDRVKLEHTPRKPDTTGDGIVYRARVHPVGHERVKTQRRGDGCSLEVAGFARGVLGDVGGGDVEAREAGETAEDEEGKANVVERGADADGEGDDGGSEAEGDL